MPAPKRAGPSGVVAGPSKQQRKVSSKRQDQALDTMEKEVEAGRVSAMKDAVNEEMNASTSSAGQGCLPAAAGEGSPQAVALHRSRPDRAHDALLEYECQDRPRALLRQGRALASTSPRGAHRRCLRDSGRRGVWLLSQNDTAGRTVFDRAGLVKYVHLGTP